MAVRTSLLARLLPVLLAALAASGCGLHANGDFGRVAPSAVHQRMGLHPYAQVPGYANTADPGVPLTADEEDLRARAYALIYTHAHRPSHGHWSQFEPVTPSRLKHDKPPSAEGYAERIAAAGYKSPEARLNAIVDDIRADRVHIDVFLDAAGRVYATDASRIRDLEQLPAAAPPEPALAERVEENRQIVEGTLFALDEKVRGYELAARDVVLLAGDRFRRAALQEVDGLSRRVARLNADFRRLDNRYAIYEPGRETCIDASIARPCQ